MKQILLLLSILFSIKGIAQCDSATLGEVLGLPEGASTAESKNLPIGIRIYNDASDSDRILRWDITENHGEFWNKPKRQVFKSFEDSIHYYQHASRDFNSKVKWDFESNRDTLKFIIPPSIIIIGTTRYKSMYLNGNWFILIDPKQ